MANFPDATNTGVPAGTTLTTYNGAVTTTSTLAGFPDANSAGVRDGVTLTQVGDMTVTTPGAVISGLEIHGTLTIAADNVTVQDCKIVNDGGYYGIYAGYDGSVTGLTVQHCDIIGPEYGLAGQGTFQFNDISQIENGIIFWNGPSTFTDNYVHDLHYGGTPHYDGMQIDGGGVHDVTIQHNTVINDDTQTSAIMIDNYFGDVANVHVDNNYLAGGAYTIFVDSRFDSSPISGVEFSNNVLGEGQYGYFSDTGPATITGSTEVGFQWPTPVSGSTISDGIIGNEGSGGPVAGSVSISDATTLEGNSGTHVETLTVTRSGGTAAFDVSFGTSNGTATVGDSDYVAASNTLHFGANQNTQTISVTINGDTKIEANETFNVALSGPTNGATVGDGQGVGTITDDDNTPPPPPPPPTNLVVNGGFETGNFNGWAKGGYQTEYIYIAPTQYPGAVHSGTYSAGFGSFNSDGTLSQTITTTAGQHYTLDFWAMSDNNNSAPDNHLAVKWDGVSLMSQSDVPNSPFVHYTFDVVGDGSSVLEFDGWNAPDAWRLDDVSLAVVGSSPPPPPPPPNTINGTSGRDTLTSTAANDTMTGLAGADTFVFRQSAFGNDVITDFHPSRSNHDIIQFDKTEFATYAAVQSHEHQVGADTVITSDSGDSVTLQNVLMSSLRSADFHFV